MSGRKILPGVIPRPARRLSDKILIAFYGACAQHEVVVAWRLLRVLEIIMTRRTQGLDLRRQQNRETLVTAHEWLWQQRHPDLGDPAEEVEAATDDPDTIEAPD